jgi:hypothetical protein
VAHLLLCLTWLPATAVLLAALAVLLLAQHAALLPPLAPPALCNSSWLL